MKIKQLIKTLDISERPFSNFKVTGISCNSKDVLDDYVFVAIKGNREDGHKFIKEAINKGARVVIIQSTEYRVSRRKVGIPTEYKNSTSGQSTR